MTLTPSQQLQKLLGNLPNYDYQETLHLYSLATALQAGLLARMHTFREQVAMPDIDHLLKVDEIAARLGTSEKWVLSRFHKLPFSVPLEGLRRFSARRFEQWIAGSQGGKMPSGTAPDKEAV